MTYQELRESVAANIEDQAELLKLVTPSNVELVTLCEPALAAPVGSYQPGDSEQVYLAGSSIASTLYDPKSSTQNTVDEVLEVFHPANIYAAELYRRTSESVRANGGKRTEFFQASDEAANQISEELC